MRRNSYVNSLLQQCATTCPTTEQGFCKVFDYAMYVPTQIPTSAPSEYLHAYVKVAMAQSFTTTLTPVQFNANLDAKNAFITIMEAKLGDGYIVTITGSNDGTRRNLRSYEEAQSEPTLEQEQQIIRRLTGTLVVEYDVTVRVDIADDDAVTSVVSALATTVTAGGFETTIGDELVALVPTLPAMTPVVPVAPTSSSASVVITQSNPPTPAPSFQATSAPSYQPTAKAEDLDILQSNLSYIFMGVIALLFIIGGCAFIYIIKLLKNNQFQASVSPAPTQMQSTFSESPVKAPSGVFSPSSSTVVPLTLSEPNAQEDVENPVEEEPIETRQPDIISNNNIDPAVLEQMNAVMNQLKVENSAIKEASNAQINELYEHKQAMDVVLAEIRAENETLRDNLVNSTIDHADVITDLQKTITKLEVNEAVRKLEEESQEELIEDLQKEIEELREAIEELDG